MFHVKHAGTEIVRISRVGADGDGVGTGADGGAVYVPFTLPGETAQVRMAGQRGVVEAITEASVARVAPVCQHFGACGGCALQHWDAAAYAAWKAGLLAAALRRAGFVDAPVAPLVTTAPGARRRADLAIRRVGGRILLGLHRAQSAEVVDLLECPVLRPALAALLVPLRMVLARLAGLRREGSAVLNLLDAGADLLLCTDAELTAADRAMLADFAGTHGLPRISWARDRAMAEPVALLRPARTRLSGVEVQPPPGAFLQASVAGEAAIVAAVLDGLPQQLPAKACVAELFAGCGSLSFALVGRARVAAFEGDALAAAALRAAAGQAGLGGRITVTQQDLARRPVLARECRPYAALVLDPPFGGAAAQIGEIAASAARRVVYVSCNPAALARDAGVLRAAGFSVQAATPIDQFLWSARLESVVVFTRGPTGGR